MAAYVFTEAERPAVTGSPYLPPISDALRVRYLLVGLTLAISAVFGNSLISSNLQAVSGEYQLDPIDGAWLVAVFAGMGAASNVFMIKGRQQFSLEPLLLGSLSLYTLAAAAEMAFPSYGIALVARALNGLATSTTVATGVYYLLQVFDAQKRALAIPIIIACLQLGAPLSRLVPVDFLVSHGNRGLHLLVLSVPLFQLLLIELNRLPPTYTARTFQPLDLVTAALVLPACILAAGVLATGRLQWWTDAPQVGWMTVSSLVLLTVALAIESRRRRPVIDIAWLTRRDIGVFMLVALIERIALAEQSSSSVGLLGSAGLGNDEYHALYACVIAGMLLGIVCIVAGLAISIKTLPLQILVALAAIAGGALIDTGADALTRPAQMVLSQGLIGFGTTLFVGPALLFFVGTFLTKGPEAYVPTILLFGAIQNLGSAAGSGLLSSVQYIGQERALTGFLSQLRSSAPIMSEPPPVVAAAYADAYRQASVIGYLDSFWVVAVVTSAAAGLIVLSLAAAALKAKQGDTDARGARS